jgi:hypothetical protein
VSLVSELILLKITLAFRVSRIQKGPFKKLIINASQGSPETHSGKPWRRLEETFREMDRCYKNVHAYMRYLRLQKEDVPQILQAAAEKYEEWLDLAGDAVHV